MSTAQCPMWWFRAWEGPKTSSPPQQVAMFPLHSEPLCLLQGNASSGVPKNNKGGDAPHV